MEKSIQTLDEFEAEAASVAASLTPSSEGATIVLLSGELGVGKTAFVKAIARTFGVAETVTSPTFILEKIYLLPKGKPFQRLIHIDAYRLEKGSDLAPLGFDEFAKDPANLILIEWPERVADVLPQAAKKITFIAHPNGSRMISYD